MDKLEGSFFERSPVIRAQEQQIARLSTSMKNQRKKALMLGGLALTAVGLLVLLRVGPSWLDPTHSTDYVLLEEITGDINLDGHRDRIVILEETDEAMKRKTSEGERILQIYFGHKDGDRKVLENRRIIMCKACGGMMGDPFVTATISPPYLTVEHYGGSAHRWYANYSFRHDARDNSFYLNHISSGGFHYSDPDDTRHEDFTERDFGKIRMDQFDYERSYDGKN